METKKIITLDAVKNKSGIIEETISLDPFYEDFEKFFDDNSKSINNSDFYDNIGEILNIKLTPEDSLIVSSWLDIGYQKNMILDACREAKYNGVINLRYIDKILYEWKKRGISSSKEADNYLKDNTDTKSISLYDYDWLNGDK